MKNNYIKLPQYQGWYNSRRIMSYDRNVFPFRIIIGARGIGKTYSMKNNYIKLPQYQGWYNSRRIMSYDRNVFPFRIIIGARGIGKTLA